MNKTISIEGSTAYHSYPDDGKKHPGLIVIEEIWGLNDNIRGIADHFAEAGYSVLAPELLPKGLLEMLTPQVQKDLFDPVKRNEVQPRLREAMQPIQQPEYAKNTVTTLKACVDYLLADTGVDGDIAVLGFCFGGTYSFHLAAQDAHIKAAIPFYGHAPQEEELTQVGCPVLAFYGEKDENLMKDLPRLKETMQKLGKDFEAVVYPNCGHAFFNETNERAYNAEAAKDAWEKTLVFLTKNLS